MKLAFMVVGGLVLFAVASAGLWRTVGGLVDQAGAREEQSVSLDVRFALTDRDGTPIPNADVRLVFGGDPAGQPVSSGQRFATDAGGLQTFTTKATLDKVQKKRPTNFVSSLFTDPELTDHLGVGAELSYMSHRWLYVAHLYRFPDGDVLHDGLSLYTRDAEGRYSRPAQRDGEGWKIADLEPMRMSTLGHELTVFAFDRKAGSDDWAVSIGFTRQPAPIVR